MATTGKEHRNKWDSQLRKGLLDFIILLVLRKKEYYGYELIKELKRFTSMDFSEGTIYPLLNRLKKVFLIDSKWVAMGTGVPRKYYRITPQGEKAVESMRESWDQISDSIEKLLRMP